MLSFPLVKRDKNAEEKDEEKLEQLEEELRRKIGGEERKDQYEGLHQISDHSVHKQLKKYIQNNMGTNHRTDQPTDSFLKAPCMHLKSWKGLLFWYQRGSSEADKGR
jgi:hypothetical protein